MEISGEAKLGASTSAVECSGIGIANGDRAGSVNCHDESDAVRDSVAIKRHPVSTRPDSRNLDGALERLGCRDDALLVVGSADALREKAARPAAAAERVKAATPLPRGAPIGHHTLELCGYLNRNPIRVGV
jgi:hypothetical protein